MYLYFIHSLHHVSWLHYFTALKKSVGVEWAYLIRFIHCVMGVACTSTRYMQNNKVNVLVKLKGLDKTVGKFFKRSSLA